MNADMIISVIQRESGARLMHGSGNAAYIDVAETAEDIIRASGKEMRDSVRTNREKSAIAIGNGIKASG